MQLIFDHLTSLLVAGVVIGVLATAQLYAQHTGLEQTTSYATKSKALSFGEWIEDVPEALRRGQGHSGSVGGRLP